MEIRIVLITHLDCIPKSGASNPHNLKCRIPPVSLARPRLYLYSNTGISIKKQSPQKSTHKAHVGVTKSPVDSLFSLQLHEISKKMCRVPGTSICDRGALEWHYLPQPATLGECAPRHRPALISTRPAPFTSAHRSAVSTPIKPTPKLCSVKLSFAES